MFTTPKLTHLTSYFLKTKMEKIDFQFEYKNLIFSDSIVLPKGHSFSDAELNEIKQNRFNQWKLLVDATAESEE